MSRCPLTARRQNNHVSVLPKASDAWGCYISDSSGDVWPNPCISSQSSIYLPSAKRHNAKTLIKQVSLYSSALDIVLLFPHHELRIHASSSKKCKVDNCKKSICVSNSIQRQMSDGGGGGECDVQAPARPTERTEEEEEKAGRMREAKRCSFS
jgi:hypothetical protein